MRQATRERGGSDAAEDRDVSEWLRQHVATYEQLLGLAFFFLGIIVASAIVRKASRRHDTKVGCGCLVVALVAFFGGMLSTSMGWLAGGFAVGFIVGTYIEDFYFRDGANGSTGRPDQDE